MLDPGVIATIAGLLGISIRDLVSALKTAHRKWRDEDEKAVTASRIANGARVVRDGLVTKALVRYYTPENLELGNLLPYALNVDGARIDTAVASRLDWIGLSVELDGGQERCQLISATPPEAQVPKESVAHLLASIEQMGLRIWNAPIYRLIDLDLSTSHLAASFALDEFLRYRFTIGLLLDELVQALVATDFSIEKTVSSKTELLPLRQQLLPDGSGLLNFRGRMCAGGLAVLFAMARPEPHNDFVIPIQRRSRLVADAQGMLSVIPKAFHQPMVDSYAELNPSFTAYRELYEELFSGEEVEKGVRRLKVDWFFQECEPLRWFRDHKGAYNFECTSFGINLVSGNYEFGGLLAVRDEDFWRRYGHLLVTNWEVSEAEGLLVSSSDPQQLSELIRMPEWAGEGLFSFAEGLRRLKMLEPRRVNLPNMEPLEG